MLLLWVCFAVASLCASVFYFDRDEFCCNTAVKFFVIRSFVKDAQRSASKCLMAAVRVADAG